MVRQVPPVQILVQSVHQHRDRKEQLEDGGPNGGEGMRMADRMRVKAHLRHTARLRESCLRYFKESERLASKYPDCKKFRGIVIESRDAGITIEIKRTEEEKE